MTQDIQNKIEFLTRGTNETAPVGALADNVSLPTNYPADESDSGPDEPLPPKIRKFIFLQLNQRFIFTDSIKEINDCFFVLKNL